ncbi:MAG: sigma-54-dependent Fis family transcriptional regulator [Deferrisomatales bacterium]
MSPVAGADPRDMGPVLDFLVSFALERTMEGVLERSREYVDRRPHVAHGCLWLAEDGAGGSRGLRLATSLGKTATGPGDWRRAGGDYTAVPLDEPLVGRAARDGATSWAAEEAGWAPPAWAREAGIAAYIASPVAHKGEVLGVLATFYYGPVAEHLPEWARWHGLVGHFLGAAVANARAFEEVEALRARLALENEDLRREVARVQAFGEILGASPALRGLLEQVAAVAGTDATVLVLGESGTGKELVARALHRGSRRRDRPLIRVNCASIPAELFESEFFGHARGAFTGAVRDRAGRFELADGGTLFLDEVGEIPLALQAKLLRVLQEGTFERVGEDRTRRADVRLVAATNRDLGAEVRAGRFREDLYFRLSVFPVEVPPLRDRAEDVPLLARHFLSLACRRLGVPEPRITAAHLSALRAYHWPGNVRELQNLLERAAILSRGGELVLPGLPAAPAAAPAPGAAPDGLLTQAQWQELQRENLRAALAQAGGRTQGPGSAAELLGIPPSTLRSRLNAWGIEAPR